MKEVTIVLPVCILDEEVHQSTDRCLEELTLNTPEELYDCIMIENGSGVKSANPKRARDSSVYIQTPIPLGAARPFNMGVVLTRTRYVVFMSNDVYVTPGWLEGLLTAYKEYGPGIIAPEESSDRPDFTPDVSWGACFITERELWQQFGGWNEEMFPWRYCDQDMAIRMRREGFAVGRTGRSVVEHKNMLTVNKMQDIIAPHAERERARMIELYGAAEFAEWMEKRGKD